MLKDNNYIIRKFYSFFFNIFRYSKPKNFVLLNSIPKSGTHLLSNTLFKFTNLKNYYGFIASTPSFNMRLRKDDEVIKMLNKVYTNELMLSHLFYSKKLSKYLIKNRIPIIFIYRNIKEIFISEINYISNMNKFHKLHKYYKQTNNFNEKFNLCFNGIKSSDFMYEDFYTRIKKYLKWFYEPNVFSVNFKDLNNSKKTNVVIDDIIKFLINHNDYVVKKNNILKLKDITSHTKTSKYKMKWKDVLNKEQKKKINQVEIKLCKEFNFLKNT